MTLVVFNMSNVTLLLLLLSLLGFNENGHCNCDLQNIISFMLSYAFFADSLALNCITAEGKLISDVLFRCIYPPRHASLAGQHI